MITKIIGLTVALAASKIIAATPDSTLKVELPIPSLELQTKEIDMHLEYARQTLETMRLRFREVERTLVRQIAQLESVIAVQRTDLSRQNSLSFTAAKQVIASDPEWQKEVSVCVFRQEDGSFSLAALRRDGNAATVRFLPLVADTIPDDLRPR